MGYADDWWDGRLRAAARLRSVCDRAASHRPATLRRRLTVVYQSASTTTTAARVSGGQSSDILFENIDSTNVYRLDYQAEWASATDPVDHRAVGDAIEQSAHTPGARLAKVVII